MLKDMDMKALDRRIKEGVKNVEISPLFKKDISYNLSTQKEDINGTLKPDQDHCWLTWKSKWFDDENNVHWSDEAYSFRTIEEAKEAKKYLLSK